MTTCSSIIRQAIPGRRFGRFRRGDRDDDAYVVNNPVEFGDPEGYDCNPDANGNYVCNVSRPGDDDGDYSSIGDPFSPTDVGTRPCRRDLWGADMVLEGDSVYSLGPCAPQGGQSDSWWQDFVSSFFSVDDWAAEFSESGCFRQFVEEALGPEDQLTNKDQIVKVTAQSAAYLAALEYSAQQGLVVPMRSSIVRGILRLGEVSGEAVALGLTIWDELAALKNEIHSFQTGQCK